MTIVSNGSGHHGNGTSNSNGTGGNKSMVKNTVDGKLNMKGSSSSSSAVVAGKTLTTGGGKDADEPFDILTKLKKRLELTKSQKEKTLSKISELNDELQLLFKRVPKRPPRETMTELDDKIQALEFKRTTQSMILSEEKLILKEIHSVQKSKTQLDEYHAYEANIQNTKSQLNDLRDALKTTNAAIDELEQALAKVTLAQKLGCTAAQLTKQEMSIPKEKVGRVIGKQGATIDAMEKNYSVQLEMDSMSGKVHLTGTPPNIQLAIAEIEKLILAIDVDVELLPEKCSYITTKHALALFRQAHPEVEIVSYREKSKLVIRGLPDYVKACKLDLEKMALDTETRTLVGREAGILLGSKGSTVNALCETHNVTIDVKETGDDVFTATIIGPDVSDAVQEIDALLEANKDTSISISVDSIVRNSLLMDSGVPIKTLQKQINENVRGGVQLSFQKETSRHQQDSRSLLVIRGRAAYIQQAREMVDSAIAAIQDSLVTVQVDPFVIPKIIGKGGEVIKKLKDGRPINIEVEKSNGKIILQSNHAEEIQRVQNEIDVILQENQCLRIKLDVAVAKTIFRELIRSSEKQKINQIVWMGLDDDASDIVLRGTRENLAEAKEIVNDFVTNNFCSEIEISAEDEPALLAGGPDSAICKFQDELNVDLSVIRSRLVVLVKGKREFVEKAVKRIHQFLHGGDGYTVRRISVTEQALGVVIGKSGAKRAELEKKHGGVNIFIHRSNRITIRGPEQNVEECRVDILRLVSSVRIQQVMTLSPEEHATLSKPDVMKRATNGIPVNITLTDDAIKIRGIYADVRDAQAMVKEAITGVYEARVELDATQLACVRGACRDPSHFQRIHESSNANVKLDLTSNTIVISGKRGNVRKAKSLVVGFLDFLLPQDFARLKISRPLFSSVGEASALADISAISGAAVILDRDLHSIQVQSSERSKVDKAVELLKEKIHEAEKRAFVVSFEASESWLIPLIIGKGGNRVNTLRMDTGCNIDVNKAERSVTVTGDDEDRVQKARELLNKMVTDARRECVFMELPQHSIAAFLGRGGANVRNFSAQHKVEVERMRKEPQKVKITGPEDAVLAAKEALAKWIEQWLQQQAGKTIEIEKMSIPAVLGKNGSVVISLQKEFGCKVDIDREALTLTVRGSTEEMRDKAVEKIQHIITEDKATHHQQDYNSNNNNNERRSSSGRNNNNDNNNNNNVISSSLDGRKDRSGEFGVRPVGLTVEPSKPKKKRNRNRNNNNNNNNNNNAGNGHVNNNNNNNNPKTRDISDDSTLQVGTTAGRNLFNLLVSETDRRSPSSPTTAVAIAADGPEQWDSSTMSSAASEQDERQQTTTTTTAAAAAASTNNNTTTTTTTSTNTITNTATRTTTTTSSTTKRTEPYIKSTSGFTVRV